VMRRTLLFGGLESISLNTKFRNQDLRLFEFGQTYVLKTDGNKLVADGYKETRRLGLFITGKKNQEHWSGKAADSTLFELKSYIGMILKRLGVDQHDITITELADNRFVSGMSYRIGAKEILAAGEVQPSLTAAFDIDQPVWFAEINWDETLRKTRLQAKYQELPKYPWVRRDLALVVDRAVKYDEIRTLAFQVERKILKEVNLFDIYESDKLGTDKKSMAVSFILMDENKTLTDKQIDQVMSGLIAAFEKKLGATLR
jgi:phenylalanyl-tRNA synthetase beta chain